MATDPETLTVWRCPDPECDEVLEEPGRCENYHAHPLGDYPDCEPVEYVPLSELQAEQKRRDDEERHADEMAAGILDIRVRDDRAAWDRAEIARSSYLVARQRRSSVQANTRASGAATGPGLVNVAAEEDSPDA